MKTKLSVLISVALAGAVFAASTVPASADATGKLNATVSVVSPCITLDQSAVDFGGVGFSSTGAPTNATKSVQITNCSGQGEDVAARGSDATDGSGGALWTLVGNGGGTNPCTLGGNRFLLWSAIDGYANPNTASSLQSGSDTVIANGLTAATPATLKATITMPCSGSAGVGSVAHFSITYTATY